MQGPCVIIMTNAKAHPRGGKGGSSFENETIQRLKEHIEWYTQQVIVQRDNIKQIDGEIVNIQTKLLQQRKARMSAEGGMPAKDHGVKMDKQIRIMERRLNQALVKFNEKIAYNKQLRGRIDELRRARVVYDRIYTNIERELHERTIEMKEIVMEGCQAVKERDKSLSDVEALKQQVRETAKALDDGQRELHEMLVKLNAEREREEGHHDEENKRAGKQQMQKSKETESKSTSVHKRNSKILNTRTDDNGKATDLQPSSADATMDSQPENPNDLGESTDVEAMLAAFYEAEEKNFSLFNHISELNLEKEQLERELVLTNKEIESLTKKPLKSYNVASDLDSKAKRIEARDSDFQEKFKAAERLSTRLKAAIKDVFYQIGCDSFLSGGNELLGDLVTDSNVMQYLAAIEQRTADVIQQCTNSRSHDTGEWPNFLITAQGGRSLPLQINPPGTDDASVEAWNIDDDGMPLTRKELHGKIWSSAC